MRAWYGNCWRWLKTRFIAESGSNLRRSRQNAFSRVAADVEQLESRQLLTVTYQGGALLPNVETQAVYLGSDWQTNKQYNTQAGQLDQYLSVLVQGQFMDALTQAGYNVYRGTSSKGVIDNITLNKSFPGGITDAQIEADLQALINAHKVQAPDANRLYVVYVEPGVLITDGDANSNNAFLGYHSGFLGTTASGTPIDIHYAVIAYPKFPTAQGYSTTSLNNLTLVTSHEVAESVTDPDVWIAIANGDFSALGWYDLDLNGEVGDITAGTLSVFRGYEIQEISNQFDVAMNPNAVTAQLTAPQNLVLTNLTPTTASLSWDPVSLVQGYRIFSISGTTRTLLGTVNASATNFTLTGLTSGVSKSYLVEAYDGTFTADSKVITGISPFAVAAASINNHAPTTAPTGSPQQLSAAYSIFQTPHLVPPLFDGGQHDRQRQDFSL